MQQNKNWGFRIISAALCAIGLIQAFFTPLVAFNLGRLGFGSASESLKFSDVIEGFEYMGAGDIILFLLPFVLGLAAFVLCLLGVHAAVKAIVCVAAAASVFLIPNTIAGFALRELGSSMSSAEAKMFKQLLNGGVGVWIFFAAFLLAGICCVVSLILKAASSGSGGYPQQPYGYPPQNQGYPLQGGYPPAGQNYNTPQAPGGYQQQNAMPPQQGYAPQAPGQAPVQQQAMPQASNGAVPPIAPAPAPQAPVNTVAAQQAMQAQATPMNVAAPEPAPVGPAQQAMPQAPNGAVPPIASAPAPQAPVSTAVPQQAMQAQAAPIDVAVPEPAPVGPAQQKTAPQAPNGAMPSQPAVNPAVPKKEMPEPAVHLHETPPEKAPAPYRAAPPPPPVPDSIAGESGNAVAKCTQCGVVGAPGAKFCINCGQPLI